jgi:hypothetical protein
MNQSQRNCWMFRVSGGSHSNTFRFGIGKASVKPLKIEVMTRRRIQLTAVCGAGFSVFSDTDNETQMEP